MINTETIKNLGLKDIHLGAEPTLVQEYITYGVLAVIAVALLLYIVIRLCPIAMALKSILVAFFKSKKFPQDLNLLLKQTAIKLYKREQVARLIGADWLNFLDHKSLSNFKGFADRWDELLYSRCEVTKRDQRALLINSILWIFSNFWRALWLK